MRRRTAVIAVAVCAVFITACGGSGRGSKSGDSASTTAESSTSLIATTTTIPLATYKVKPKDTLTSIAKRFGVSIAAIRAANQIANPDLLTEGQTLKIPPAPPRSLVVTPPEGPQGTTFALDLRGAQPGELITFEIASPGRKFTGPPHIASADGAVKTTYQTSLTERTGTFAVTARGNRGTTIRASFVVTALPTDHT